MRWKHKTACGGCLVPPVLLAGYFYAPNMIYFLCCSYSCRPGRDVGLRLHSKRFRCCRHFHLFFYFGSRRRLSNDGLKVKPLFITSHSQQKQFLPATEITSSSAECYRIWIRVAKYWIKQCVISCFRLLYSLPNQSAIVWAFRVAY